MCTRRASGHAHRTTHGCACGNRCASSVHVCMHDTLPARSHTHPRAQTFPVLSSPPHDAHHGAHPSPVSITACALPWATRDKSELRALGQWRCVRVRTTRAPSRRGCPTRALPRTTCLAGSGGLPSSAALEGVAGRESEAWTRCGVGLLRGAPRLGCPRGWHPLEAAQVCVRSDPPRHARRAPRLSRTGCVRVPDLGRVLRFQ